MSRIVIVDDESLLDQTEVREIFKEFNLPSVHLKSTDEFKRSLDNGEFHSDPPLAFVIDMIMPPGFAYRDRDHQNQTRTGIFVLEDILRSFNAEPKFECPVVVYSKIGAEPQLQKDVDELVEAYGGRFPIPIRTKDGQSFEARRTFCEMVITLIHEQQ